MIRRIHITNFKSFRSVQLELGPLNLFIGTNASGKSNFFDALRLLQGIGNGFTIEEILNGKPKSATSEVWEGIRGGSGKACFSDESDETTVGFLLDVDDVTYRIAFDARTLRLIEEYLSLGGNTIYDSRQVSQQESEPVFRVRYFRGSKGPPPHLKFEPSRPVLGQIVRGHSTGIRKDHQDRIREFQTVLANMQRVDPSPGELRKYSQAHTIGRMGEHGENFAALITAICADNKVKNSYVSWLRELRPSEVDDVGTLSGAVGEPMFMLKEGSKVFPAPVLSDGTLRFAAIAAAFFQPDMPLTMTIEEIENGIHAARLRLLVELLRSHSRKDATQLFVTTHSPIVLSWLQKEEYQYTFYCQRDEESGESLVKPLTEISAFQDVIRRQPIADLFAEGWMESAI